ncbi:hypothetical protein AaE_008407 [Aphanomyces astaci]|uniref:Uncharacterized protein n=1 Tax=Aphanomyces astaci TaxID=112090 RepID=A0A6A4ZZY2_APHAT|nr:hypothetical protein AaE_008407 [Aphanomyces astaci]
MICKASGVSVGNVSECTYINVSTKSPLSFCIEYQDPRCCMPVHEAQIITYYTALMDTGVSCKHDVTNTGHVPLKKVFCSPCSPLAPLYLSPPTNKTFFTSATTFKICRSLAAQVSPELFDHCGFAYVDRVQFCTPKQAIAPGAFFKACGDGDHVCYRQNETQWYCHPSTCGSDVPVGFADVPCFKDTCSSVFKMLNDNRGAKPPFHEDTAMEIVDDEYGKYCLGMASQATDEL